MTARMMLLVWRAWARRGQRVLLEAPSFTHVWAALAALVFAAHGPGLEIGISVAQRPRLP